MPAQRDQSIRAFIAVELPDHVKEYLIRLQKRIKSEGISASWPKPETMHLTVRFLGRVDIAEIETIRQIMAAACKPAAPFFLQPAAVGVFPGVNQAKVLWSGVRGRTDVLDDIAHRLENLLWQQIRLKKSKRFSPHLTLARIKKRIPSQKVIQVLQQFKEERCPKFLVKELFLYESRLKPEGAVHKKLGSARL